MWVGLPATRECNYLNVDPAIGRGDGESQMVGNKIDERQDLINGGLQCPVLSLPAV
jgi:hypothetical protein